MAISCLRERRAEHTYYVGQSRKWNCDVCRPNFVSVLAESEHTPQGLFSRGPECLLLLEVRCKVKVSAVMSLGDGLDE
jgi:hypothetical protein